MDRNTWFNAVSECTNKWGRVNSNTLWLRFNGYKTGECYESELKLKALGGFVFNLEFDPIPRQTVMYIREPKTLNQSE